METLRDLGCGERVVPCSRYSTGGGRRGNSFWGSGRDLDGSGLGFGVWSLCGEFLDNGGRHNFSGAYSGEETRIYCQTRSISAAPHCGVRRSRSRRVPLLSGNNGGRTVSEVGGSIRSGGYAITVFGGLGLSKKGIGRSPTRQGGCGLSGRVRTKRSGVRANGGGRQQLAEKTYNILV